MGTKTNPGKYDCYAKAEQDEPLFVLLARDPLAPSLVRHWVELRNVMGLDDGFEKLREANQCADDMENWAADHPDHGR